MKPALLLIDLQNDFLRAPGFEPAPGQLIERAAALLAGARAAAIPILHVCTSINLEDDRRMPHWKRVDRRSCLVGTAGHATPPALRPLAAEPVIHKIYFSPFSTGELDRVLSSLAVDTLILAGVYLHSCIRAAALDAYQRGFEIWVAEDAVGSDDPLHAAVTRRYLAPRAARFVPVESCLEAITRNRRRAGGGEEPAVVLPAAIIRDAPVRRDEPGGLVHHSPCGNEQPLWRVPCCGSAEVATATAAAREAVRAWQSVPCGARGALLHRLARVLEADSPSLAQAMAVEIGKPVTLARAELARAIALLEAVAARATEPLEMRCTADSVRRDRALGVIAMVTPWNNPLAIPLGKIAPALLYGNAVVWKPGPAGSAIAVKLMEYLREAGCPAGLVNLLCGDQTTALALMADPGVDAITVTGSPAVGYAAQDFCGRRHLPLQAELGGNNGAIVWADCDLGQAATAVADAAFAFAGQRCTANRRVIVDERVYERFTAALRSATAALAWGDPRDAKTRVGPLISTTKRRAVGALVDRARAAGATVWMAHADAGKGAYHCPTIIDCDDPSHEVVQEETFGPVLVVQRAGGWEQAMQLCQGVRQGLVAALFSASTELQTRFLEEAQAGILKINRATADANVEAPFGGWKASGIGPPEHGACNREFFTRAQAVYRDAPRASGQSE